MSYFEDVYKKRLNRFGTTQQTRVQGQREYEFEQLLLKSQYRVDFMLSNVSTPGLLERYRQDNTRTLQYLLVRVDTNIAPGTILKINNKDNVEETWMVYYLDKIKTSGYNRYIVMSMSHYLTWKNRAGAECKSWAYMFGPGSSTIRSMVLSGKNLTLYAEPANSSFLVMPTTTNIKNDDYIVIGEGDLQEQYVVTGYDIHSTPGVEYVTISPTYKRDTTPLPEPSETDTPENTFWLPKQEV